MTRSIEIAIEESDIRTFTADVVALKYAQKFYGADRAVAQALATVGIPHDMLRVRPGDHRLISTREALQAPKALFVGVKPVYELDYQHIQALARDVLTILATNEPRTRTIVMTTHGGGFGLDEEAALRAQIFGYLEALQHQQVPEGLERISIVSHVTQRVTTYRQIVERMRRDPSCMIDVIGRGVYRLAPRSVTASREQVPETAIADVGKVADSKPHAFIAMAFGKETDDLYHYGIRQAVDANDLLCIRIDKDYFEGGIFDFICKRIDTADVVIADVSGANPNVYLEVGYAWGKGKSTILLVRDVKELRFDVQATRCIVYDSIRTLELMLTEEIRNMRASKKS